MISMVFSWSEVLSVYRRPSSTIQNSRTGRRGLWIPHDMWL